MANSNLSPDAGNLKAKWWYFYPATSPSCARRWVIWRTTMLVQKMGVEVYGVSTDTHFTHKALARYL